MSKIKSHKEDLGINSAGNTIIQSNGSESIRVRSDGVVTTEASNATIDSSGGSTIVSKGYIDGMLHTHSNQSILDGTTASFTTTEATKLSGIEDNAQPNMTQADVNALNVNAGSLDGASLSTATGLGTSNTLIPSQNAVKVYSDGKVTTHQNSYHTSNTVFLGRKNAAQGLGNSVSTRVTWPNIVYNVNNGLTTAGYWIAPIAGYYYFSAQLSMVWSSTWGNGERLDIYMRKEGTYHFNSRRTRYGSAGVTFSHTIGGQMWVAAGDYVDIVANQNSGATLNTTLYTTIAHFSGELVAYN